MSKISINRMVDLCHRVAESYKAGIDLRTIWNRESKTGPPTHQAATGNVAREIDNGVMLGTALENQNGYFPPLLVAVATAGEQGGRLERAFFLLRDHFQTLLRFRKKVLVAIAWPVFQLVAAIFIMGAMILIMDFVVKLADDTKTIDWLGFNWTAWQYFALYVFVVTFFVGSIAALIIGTVRGWYGKAPMEIARRLPLIGKIIEYLSLSRCAWVLAVVSEAGINVKEGVRLAMRATDNFYYQGLEQGIADDLQAGKDLTESLTATNVFPAEFLMYVENGEMTGNLPESMQKIADDYLERVDNLFKYLSYILFLLCFLAIGFIVIVAIIVLFKAVVLDPTNDMIRDLGG